MRFSARRQSDSETSPKSKSTMARPVGISGVISKRADGTDASGIMNSRAPGYVRRSGVRIWKYDDPPSRGEKTLSPILSLKIGESKRLKKLESRRCCNSGVASSHSTVTDASGRSLNDWQTSLSAVAVPEKLTSCGSVAHQPRSEQK